MIRIFLSYPFLSFFDDLFQYLLLNICTSTPLYQTCTSSVFSYLHKFNMAARFCWICVTIITTIVTTSGSYFIPTYIKNMWCHVKTTKNLTQSNSYHYIYTPHLNYGITVWGFGNQSNDQDIFHTNFSASILCICFNI